MKRIALLVLPFFFGCSAIEQTQVPTDVPELVRSTPLPPILSATSGGGLRFNVRILVLKDGTVGDVKLQGSSGDESWDAIALDSIRKWQFTPARRDGEPLALWVRQPLIVQAGDHVMRTLAQLVCATRHEADSLYALIQKGENLDSIFLRPELGESTTESGFLGAVDLSTFAPPIRSELLNLSENQTTRPLRYGINFVIFKRLKKEPV